MSAAKIRETEFSTCLASHTKPSTGNSKKAGIQKLDALVRKVDFHALHNTFATKLSRDGVPQRMIQEPMRHSDPKLTAMFYTDAARLPTFKKKQDLKRWKTTNRQDTSHVHSRSTRD